MVRRVRLYLDADLIARHAQVHDAEEQAEEGVHDVLDGQRVRVARLLAPLGRDSWTVLATS
jgi:hypothetical protein